MKITEKEIKALGPCSDGWEWYLENKEDDLLKLLLSANKEDPSYSRWLFTELMTKEQCIKIAIFSAREVLYLFEDKYPEDKSPRKAIEAAEKYLKDPSEENRKAAADADAAAYAAYAYATYAYDAAVYAAAADAVYAAVYAAAAAAYTAAAYAYAAAAYAYAAKKETQEKIIKEAARILEEEK